MIQRFFYAVCGAILGAIACAGFLWYLDEINWTAVGVFAGVCAAIAFVFGEPFITFLKEVAFDSWW